MYTILLFDVQLVNCTALFFLVRDLILSYFTDVDDEDLNRDPGEFI